MWVKSNEVQWVTRKELKVSLHRNILITVEVMLPSIRSHEDLIAEKGTYYRLYTGAFELE